MNAFEQFIAVIAMPFGSGDSVQPYGAFHLTSFAVAVIAAILMCVFLSNVKVKTMRLILIAVGGFMVLLEVYKQLIMSFDGASGEWRYQWSAFPFQFCATPMYAILLAGLLKGGRFRDGLIAYISTFTLAAGVCVFIFLGDVYASSLFGVCLQTTVYHGLMIVVGAWLMVWNRKRGAPLHDWIWALVAFFGFEAIALTLNVVINGALGAGTVDLYFLSVSGTSDIPVVGILREKLPYFAYLAMYNVGFSLGAFCLYSLSIRRRRSAYSRS